jgi:peptidoglycan/LPS O-acetylase OafA/YrhL
MTSLAQLAAAGLLIAASVQNTWVYSTLSVSPLVSFGMISYSVYLWHYPAAVFFRGLLPWEQTVPIVLVCVISAATVSYLTIERPLQRYRHSLKARDLEVDVEPTPAGDDHAFSQMLPQARFAESRIRAISER